MQERTSSLCVDEPFQVGEWRVNPQLNRVEQNGTFRKMEPKVMAALCLLARHAGDVVTREDFATSVWNGTHVGEEALNRVISGLRKSLDDDVLHPKYIETIRKVGYRLVAKVSPGSAKPSKGSNSTSILAKPNRFIPLISALAIVLAAAVVTALTWWSGTSRSRRALTLPLQRQAITAFRGIESQAALSPTGSHVAFVWSGENNDNVDLYMRLVGSESLLRLTHHRGVDVFPDWSRDAQKLAFLRLFEDRPPAIMTVSALGKDATHLLSLHDDDVRRGPVWSPSSDILAFTDIPKDYQLHKIVLFDINSEDRVIVDPDAHFRDIEPRFSPDGSRLAFIRTINHDIQDVFSLDMERNTISRLTHHLNALSGFDWTADGRFLIVSSNRAGFRSLHKVDLKTGTTTWISGSGHHAKHPCVSRSDECLVFEDWIYEINLWKVTRATLDEPFSSPEILISSTQKDQSPQFSPNGQSISFISSRSGSPAVYRADSSGGNITRLAQAFDDNPARWSPDGKRLVHTRRNQNLPGVFVFDMESRQDKAISNPDFAAIFPRWAPDNDTLFYASFRDGSWQIWSQRFGEDAAHQITQIGAFSFDFSQDGKSLFFTKPGDENLFRLDMDSGVEEAVINSFIEDQDAFWMVWQGKILVVRTGQDNRPVLVSHELKTGDRHELFRFPSRISLGSIGLSPDAKTLLFAQVDRCECDLVMLRQTDD